MNDNKFEDLSTYLSISKKVIAHFAPHFYSGLAQEMLDNEDCISDVATAIMRADEKWNPNYRSKIGTVRTKYSYRNQYAIWAISEYVTNKKNQPHNISLSYISEDNDILPIRDIISDSNIDNPVNIAEHKETQQYQSQLINKILSCGILTPCQEKYIRARHLKGQTLQQIGDEYNVSKEAVRQGLEKGMKILRNLV